MILPDLMAGLERLRPKGFGASRALVHDGPQLPLGQGGLRLGSCFSSSAGVFSSVYVEKLP